MSAELLVGNWKLVSWQVVSEDGARDFFGSKPKGSLILTREGRAMALTTAEKRTPGETEPERAALYTSMLAYSLFVMRSRYPEDCLAESLSDGVRQYVILGAGLDTFAYRQPLWARPLHVFEVDHPASQQWKRRRLLAAGIAIPDNVRLAPVDFESVTLTEGLSAAGLDFAAPTFFALLGVSQYLTEASLDLTLRFVLSMPASSEIVLSFVLPESARPPDEAALVAAFAARSAEMGEPWLTAFLPDALVAKLKAMGFSRVAHLSPEAASGRYFGDRSDGLCVWRNEQMVRATV